MMNSGSVRCCLGGKLNGTAAIEWELLLVGLDGSFLDGHAEII